MQCRGRKGCAPWEAAHNKLKKKMGSRKRREKKKRKDGAKGGKNVKEGGAGGNFQMQVSSGKNNLEKKLD